MDIYEVLLHGNPVTIQLSLEDAEHLGVAPQHAAEEAEEEDKPRGK
jgi:hypothetical protein